MVMPMALNGLNETSETVSGLGVSEVCIALCHGENKASVVTSHVKY